MKTSKTAERIRQAIVEQVALSGRPVRLGELYRAVAAQVGPLTLGQFHDALRDLAASGAVRLEPWTGAMYQLQDPECCLLVGREIIGYASRCSS